MLATIKRTNIQNKDRMSRGGGQEYPMNTPSRVVPSSEAALQRVSAGSRDHRQEAKGQGEKNTQRRLMRERPGQPL